MNNFWNQVNIQSYDNMGIFGLGYLRLSINVQIIWALMRLFERDYGNNL